jgi:threonine/homoserine/homoserine lactone efflux protein
MFSPSINANKYLFHAGFMISLLAALAPGIVNILTVRLVITESYIVASWFAIGAVTAELISARICLELINRAFKFEFAVRILQWLVVIIFVAFSIMSFIASVNGSVEQSNPIRNDLSPFIFGFLTMAINPGMIPLVYSTI